MGAPDASTPMQPPPTQLPGEDGGASDAGEPPALRVKSIVPARGPAGGGIRVDIVGTGFMAGATRVTDAARLNTVHFGSNTAIDVEVIDDTTLSVRLPPGTPGPGNVSVSNPWGTSFCNGCFTWYEELHVGTLSPARGSTRGGTHVALDGAGLTPPVAVLFGGRAASPSGTHDGGIDVTTPAAASAGAADVLVYGANGIVQLRGAFRYVDALRAQDVSPMSGPAAGGSTVTVTGTGLDRVTAVRFGATDVVPLAATASALTVVSPPGTAGPVDVTLVGPGETWVVRGGFSYTGGAAFAIYAVRPHVGADVVTVVGEGLDAPGLTALVGGSSATVLSQSPNALRIQVPARGAGPRVADVEVGGAVLSGAYTYGIAIDSLAPTHGPSTGGTAVAVSARNLPPATEATLGGVAVTLPAFNTSPGSGAADLWVRDAADPENETQLTGAFSFDDALWVGAVQPGRASIAGGARVTLYGSGFGTGTTVLFGGVHARDVKIVDSHTLTCRVPQSNVGTVDVTVHQVSADATLPGGFAYFDPRNTYGGLSGGPLQGTLNVTVLSDKGLPLPLAQVLLGLDNTSPLQGLTDTRGQITFSDDALVKALPVSAWVDGYAATTFASVGSENATLLLQPIPGGSPPPPPPAPPLVPISGRVTGFKASRELKPGEALQARVSVAEHSVFDGLPFQSPENRSWEQWQVDVDNGGYRVVSTPGLQTVYAILGIYNEALDTFEPVLMGIRRGVQVSQDVPPTGQDIVLDTYLDVSVPATILGPTMLAGMPAIHSLYAWLDLGGDGLIPNPYNASVRSTGTTMVMGAFPPLEGSDFLFLDLAESPQQTPFTGSYRRQPGDLSNGVTIGPMLDSPDLDWVPTAYGFPEQISWQRSTGATPDLIRLDFYWITPFGPILVWTVIAPGTEDHVELVQPVSQWIQDQLPGQSVEPTIWSVTTPRFDPGAWTYEALSSPEWTNFASAYHSGFTL
jgi:hypothetical protein